MTPSFFQDFIAVYDQALPEQLCEQWIQQFERSAHQIAGRTGHGVDEEKKRSTDIALNAHAEWQPVLQTLLQHVYPGLRDYFLRLKFPLIGALSPTVVHPKTGKPCNLSLDNFDDVAAPLADQLIPYMYRYGTVNLQRYRAGEGGYFHWHSEIYPQDERCEPLHRVLLFMFYLNDVEDGGETEFFYQKVKLRPKRGSLVLAPAGFTHTHRGNMPVSNDKYIATSWICFQRAEQLFAKR